jgi:ribosomal protein S18 acetylase RimI-like enzyme
MVYRVSMTPETSEPAIRRATAADVSSLGRLGALLVQKHYEFDRHRFLEATAHTRQHYGAFLASQVDDPDAVLLVAEQDGVVIAYAYGTLEGYDYMALRGPAAVLHDLLVDPAYRGRGLGRSLLDAMLSAFTSKGAPQVVLFTAERNEAAQRFFERLGFRPTMIEMTRELA